MIDFANHLLLFGAFFITGIALGALMGFVALTSASKRI